MSQTTLVHHTASLITYSLETHSSGPIPRGMRYGGVDCTVTNTAALELGRASDNNAAYVRHNLKPIILSETRQDLSGARP